ncbi:Uncharacterized protein FKW44_001850 [Caligus rogercresseyi]|uniref:Uncharacterized protein n=1 Tax=Caligus rogercresseyi TaxID=217165 RepID=A0A7T8KJE2_CALRO|nr:Uncharacterized protein FKW44_001850 [Caligus rogercresseyi]
MANHFDYINALYADEQFVATGGKGDKLIFVYEAQSLKPKYKLEGHTGWITGLFVQDSILISSSADQCIKTWNLTNGSLLRTFEEDAGITVMLPAKELILFGDAQSKLSFLNRSTGETLHLLPNILIGTGRYSRSSKYHDKGE